MKPAGVYNIMFYQIYPGYSQFIYSFLLIFIGMKLRYVYTLTLLSRKAENIPYF